jgi:hypothetical protein
MVLQWGFLEDESGDRADIGWLEGVCSGLGQAAKKGSVLMTGRVCIQQQGALNLGLFGMYAHGMIMIVPSALICGLWIVGNTCMVWCK